MTLRSIYHGTRQAWASYRDSQYQAALAPELDFTAAARRFPERNALHRYMHHSFRHHLPEELKRHRAYFAGGGRGYGENALHAMWWLIFKEFRPLNCLEIGVYRGQAISLWAMAARRLGYAAAIAGVSPFSAAGDAVSVYSKKIDYLADVRASFERFHLPQAELVQAYSTDAAARDFIGARKWDLMYIDGCHDYEVALADYNLCRAHLAPKGLLILDDASLNTSFRPPCYSFAGHPGPSRVAAETAQRELTFLGAVGHNNVFCKAGVV